MKVPAAGPKGGLDTHQGGWVLHHHIRPKSSFGPSFQVRVRQGLEIRLHLDQGSQPALPILLTGGENPS